jgi:ABC-type protease/lipase transport system fused ATPase/permease subunit
MPSFPTLTARAIFFIVGLLVLIGVVAFTVRSCDKRHSRAAQTRVERSQAEAAANSAADAIGTVAASGEAERASEDLTRINEQQIRAAEGSNAAVNPAARDAGIAALCRRQAYRDDPRCKR